MKKNYEFKDLFDADLNQSSLGKKNRREMPVSSLVQLETLYPSK